MEIDPRDMPSPEATENITKDDNSELKASETTVNKAPIVNEELEALKIKNLELLKQKEHWKDKYDRDINNQKPIEEIPEDYMSDEGKALKAHISKLEETISSITGKQEFEKLSSQHPVLKDKVEEFNEFKTDYPGIGLEKVAKLFLLEKGLLDTPTGRIGLERGSGGNKTPVKTGISMDDVKRMREDTPRLYEKMLRTGKLNPDDIN